MSPICRNCNKETLNDYLINQLGDIFCNEECHEQFADKTNLLDDDHPYYNEYYRAREVYLYWLNWERELEKSSSPSWDVNVMIEQMDEAIASFRDFIYSEGDDGPYAWEIYQYTRKLRAIQLQIIDWFPKNRNEHYYLYVENRFCKRKNTGARRIS